MVVNMNRQMLIGSLDFAEDKSMTNSALLINPGGKLAGKYDKFHRVPFGEYVPFREYLPESWIRAFDMGRDLTAGTAIEPLQINDDIRAGTAVCYEGVFSYLSAAFARNNANVLAAVSNDVWYPASSEPEQHLANAVMRCVETGLPMVRCGNNGGSGVVNVFGEFTQYIGSKSDRPELLREKAAGAVTVEVEKNPELTMAVRFENLIVYCLITAMLAGADALMSSRKTK
jgi:apolipoprotein N-acyltransferase